MKYSENQLRFNPGDRIFLYTDGVTEAKSKDDSFYTSQRLLDELNRVKESDPENTVKYIGKSVDDFQSGVQQYDDITMLCFEFKSFCSPRKGSARSFSADKCEFSNAVGFIRDEVSKYVKKETVLRDIEIASSEVVANICSYAYPKKDKEKSVEYGSALQEDTAGNDACHSPVKELFDVCITNEDRSISIEFSDYGIQYNPLDNRTPDTTIQLKDRKTGGLGVYIVRKLMNDVYYRYENGKNILTLIKVY